MKRSWLVTSVLVGSGLVPGGAGGQELVLPAERAVAAAEALGASHPRPTTDLAVPAWWEFDPVGTSDRVCVDVTVEPTREATPVAPTFRSGEMVIGGWIPRLQAGVRTKLWWKPLNSSLDMTLDLVSRSLDGVGGEAAFTIGPVTSTYTNDRPPQPIPDEAFFPGAVEFPVTGRWIVVATSGDNWGCFVFDVPTG